MFNTRPVQPSAIRACDLSAFKRPCRSAERDAPDLQMAIEVADEVRPIRRRASVSAPAHADQEKPGAAGRTVPAWERSSAQRITTPLGLSTRPDQREELR